MTDKCMLLKWVGGKTKLLHHILPKFPTEIDNYYEICIGGASVLLGVIEAIKENKMKVNKLYAFDLNPELINFYQVIQKFPNEFILETSELVNEYNNILVSRLGTAKNDKTPKTFEESKLSQENFYYWQRKQYNETQGTIIRRASLFYFLNKTCFRGLYRTGPLGFNVPYGEYKKILLDQNIVMNMSNLIRDVVFEVKSFEESLSLVGEKDFAYIDPPYIEEKSTSFTAYMGKFPHEVLLSKLLEMREKKLNFVMSNSDVPIIHEKFSKEKFNIDIIVARRAINSKDPSDSTNETIVSCKF